MLNKPICCICYENIGKIYRNLHCNHKFHHKCLKLCEKSNNTIHKCPYCRQEYENIILRDRTSLITLSEKEKKENFVNYIQLKLKECKLTLEVKDRLLIVNIIYKKIIKNINILLNPRYGFIPTFNSVVKNKVVEIFENIQEINETGEIAIGYQEFCKYKIIILNKL